MTIIKTTHRIMTFDAYAEWHLCPVLQLSTLCYAECHYAECHSAECRGVTLLT